jgi:hypothetical protein
VNNIKSTLSLLLPALLFSITAAAQKLPNLQKEGLKAPSGIKINGKANEWGAFQAYNRAIQASYTLANDNDKLYLVVQSNRKEIINKIVNGGVTLTVNKTKKVINSGIGITYPVFNMQDRPMINLNTLFDVATGTTDGDRKMDSLVKMDNSMLNDKAKFIRLNNVDDADTLISVYNKEGVKAYTAFDNNKTYTLEMAINLKLLGLSAKDQTKFNYDIRFNAIQIDYVPGVEITRNPDGVITLMNVTNSKVANSFISALNTTDCWGEYTLVK